MRDDAGARRLVVFLDGRRSVVSATLAATNPATLTAADTAAAVTTADATACRSPTLASM
jgi:hypothetical protein